MGAMKQGDETGTYLFVASTSIAVDMTERSPPSAPESTAA
jgi:hypothetical protein